VAVEGVVCHLATPFAMLQPWFRLLIPRIFDGVNACLKDVLGNMPIGREIDNGARV